jgi:alpha-L-fucosidase
LTVVNERFGDLGYANRRVRITGAGQVQWRITVLSPISARRTDGTTFHPIESDFPLRKGCFYHENERGTTKSAEYLGKLYLSSVGNVATMNIGISPTRDGLLDDDDVKALAGFKVQKDDFCS